MIKFGTGYRKYGNTKVEFNGRKFDSKLERDRFMVLERAQEAGKIERLVHHNRIKLYAHGVHICTIIPDFTYTVKGNPVTEDTKSPASITDAFRIKAKMFEAQEGHPVKIITKETLHSEP